MDSTPWYKESQSEAIRDTLVPAPCPIGAAVLTLLVIASVPLLITRSDCVRHRCDNDRPIQWALIPLHEKALHELKAAGERVADRREGPTVAPSRV